MDEKLTTMAKSTVFADCSHRQLVQLGRQFEIARLRPGTTLRANGPGRWLHVVLDGRLLGIVDGEPDAVLGEGAVWCARPSRVGGLHTMFALTDVVVASIAVRALGAVDVVCPVVAATLRDVPERPAPAIRRMATPRTPTPTPTPRVGAVVGGRNA